MNLNKLLLLFFFSGAFSQENDEKDLLNNLIVDKKSFYLKREGSKASPTNFAFKQLFTLNNGIPNLENRNGIYAPKGSLVSTSIFFGFKSKYIAFSAEPAITKFDKYESKNIYENSIFKYSNSTFSELNKITLKNFKIHLMFNQFIVGYENTTQWWGPGIHNSLIISSNADPLPRYFIKTKNKKSLINEVSYQFKIFSTKSIKNEYENDYYISAIQTIFSYNNLELGISRLIFSGVYDDDWNFKNAINSLVSNKKSNNHDSVNDLYILYSFPSSKTKFFAEFGQLNHKKTYKFYRNNTLASILGMRKYGVLGRDNLAFGVEYTRLVQSPFFDRIPTQNWYDNPFYDYSTFNERIIGSHSGSDSDDFLLYLGIIEENKSIVVVFNYERHGITYKFPPEVKLERKIVFNYLFSDLSINIEYENEHFRHYGFVDSNQNVWKEEFENGSVKNSKTLLVSLAYKFF